MSDSDFEQDESNSGQEMGLPRVAYEMAKDLWFETHGRRPNMEDTAFFLLVRTCSVVLSGSAAPGDSIKSWVKGFNH
ncbi:hypothetical protein AB9K41_15455 [Cribrihabitans sp. XS_ASV171]